MKKITKERIFINNFSKIKVGSICNEYGIDVSNLKAGRTSLENEKKVYKRILKDIISLLMYCYLEDEIEVINDERTTL